MLASFGRLLAAQAVLAACLCAGPALAQKATLAGTLAGATKAVTGTVRDAALTLPPFRINPTAGTTNFQAAITVDGLSRVFYVIQPTATVRNAPAIFLLHGLGMTADRMANYTDAGSLTAKYGAWIFLPQALGNNDAWSNDPSDTSGADDVAFLDALIQVAITQYSINHRRIYFAGLSSGAFMADLMACRSPKAIAAVFAVSGSIRNSVQPVCAGTRPMPYLNVHGTADPIIQYDGVYTSIPDALPILTSAPDTAAFWADHNGCTSATQTMALPDVASDTTTVNRRNYTGCPTSAPVAFLSVSNGGHTWPGTPFATYTIGLGPTTQDFSATQLMWDFMSPFLAPL